MQMQMQAQNKPGTVSMSTMINYAALKIYTDFFHLTNLIRSQGDSERKTEIVEFLRRSRSLLIRLQALNKWTTSAIKVDKCEKISNLLDEQSSYLMLTAQELSILSRERLPNARLPNSMPIIAADIFATKTYSRLPNHIRLCVIHSKPINTIDKFRMFDELNRILRIRLSNSKIPYRMRNITINDGRVTFKVENEFLVTCTLMSDHFDHPWRVLNVLFLVNGNDVCRGRSLVHKNHLRDYHRQVQNRLQMTHLDNYPSLYHLYDMLHSMSLMLQLAVLNEQLNHYIRYSQGIKIEKPSYVRGHKLSFSYWMCSDKYVNRPIHSLIITVDEEDSRRPLKIKHNPPLWSDGYNHPIIDASNLSIKNIISQCISVRIYSSLKIIQRLLFPFVFANKDISQSKPVLSVPILSDHVSEHCLTIRILSSPGIVDCKLDIRTDFLSATNRSRINQILAILNKSINELFFKTYDYSEIVNQKRFDTIEIRELVEHRRQIADCLNKLRIILSSYRCFYVLQKAGYNDMKVFFSNPTFLPMKGVIKDRQESFYYLKDLEARNECELVYIPLNNEWNYFLLVVCETRSRLIPRYKVYELNTMKVYASSHSNFYNEKSWTLRPIKLTCLTADIVKKMINLKGEEGRSFAEHHITNKRKAPTCNELISKRLKLSGSQSNNTLSEAVQQMDNEDKYFRIEYLPLIISYMKENLIFKLLLHELERRLLFATCQKINENIFVLNCQITKFSRPPNCSERANCLMNKLLCNCNVKYFNIPSTTAGFDIFGKISWQVHFQLKSPLLLLVHQQKKQESLVENEKSTIIPKKLMTKDVDLSCRKVVEDNGSNVRYTIDKLINMWGDMCLFCNSCFLPLLDNFGNIENEIIVTNYDFNTITMAYGTKKQYTITVNHSEKGAYKISLGSTDPENPNYNPHSIIKKDLEGAFNKYENIYCIISLILETLEFLTVMYPYHDSDVSLVCEPDPTNLIGNGMPCTSTGTGAMSSGNTSNSNVGGIQGTSIASASSSTTGTGVSTCPSGSSPLQLVRNYSLIVQDPYRLMLVFREKFALNVQFNCDTRTVQLSDAYNNFHACNMSIIQMPIFKQFLARLEEAYRINIEDEIWSGLFTEQLLQLLSPQTADDNSDSDNGNGATTPTATGSRPSLLESYLLAALQLGGRSEISFPVAPITSDQTALSACTTRIVVRLAPYSPGQQHKQYSEPVWGLQMELVKPTTSLASPAGGDANAAVGTSNAPASNAWLIAYPQLFLQAKRLFDQKVARMNTCANSLNVFKRLLQLPSLRLQRNLLTILTEPAVTITKLSSSEQWRVDVDLDWKNWTQEPICQQQDPSSIILRFLVTALPIQAGSISKTWKIVMHYAAKSNEIALISNSNSGTSSSIINLGIDTEVNQLFLVRDEEGDTPLITFFSKLSSRILEIIN